MIHCLHHRTTNLPFSESQEQEIESMKVELSSHSTVVEGLKLTPSLVRYLV